MKLTRLMVALAVGLCGLARGEVTHLTYPIPGKPKASQAIQNKVYDLNQKTPKRIAWGISGRFAGIDSMVQPSHQKFGIQIQLIYDDGPHDWITIPQKFTAKTASWQHLSGLHLPRRAVKRAVFYYRLATPGEAWYDGVTLFEVPDAPAREDCHVTQKDGEITIANGFLRCKILPNEGATVSELLDRRTGVNYAGTTLNRRLLLDRFRGGGDCYRGQWKVDVVKADKDETSVAFRLAGVPGQQYLDVSRLMTLKRGSSALDVRYAWHNQPASMADMIIEPWVVNGL